MGPVHVDEGISRTRAAIFPFFDSVEIAFCIGIVVLECIVLWLNPVRNGWVIPIGSYFGMVIVARTGLPSCATIPRSEVELARRALEQMRMLKMGENRFVPNLPALLRWPRNVVVIDEGPSPFISGPGLLLRSVRRHLQSELPELR